MAESRMNEALEKLNRGIEESKQMVQQQTMQLAQDFFDDSAAEVEDHLQQSRSALERLPEQIPGGDEEAFQMLFQELMDSYAAIEKVLGEARENVANLDTESLARQAELDATDAARREARELGVDLLEVEGTGSGGRITVEDVKGAAENAEDDAADGAADGGPRASEAALRRAEELGVDLQQVEGSGRDGLITVKDVMAMANGSASGAAEGASQAVEQEAGGTSDGEEDPEGPRATNAARRRAEELGVDLSQIEGTGADGVITIKDVVES